MKEKAFVDTNILVYAYTDTDITKHDIAQSFLENIDENIELFVSIQVIKELCSTMKRLNINTAIIKNCVEEITNSYTVLPTDIKTIFKSIENLNKFKLSWYDTLLITTALNYKCKILYSEDMNNGMILDNKMTIKNPFKLDNLN